MRPPGIYGAGNTGIRYRRTVPLPVSKLTTGTAPDGVRYLVFYDVPQYRYCTLYSYYVQYRRTTTGQ
jgi:hypothetical protein